MTEIEAVILGGVFGIMGVIVGSNLSRKTTLEVLGITEYNKAAATFRSKFIRELRELGSVVHFEDMDSDFVYKLICSAIIRHEIAYIMFSVYISDNDREGFDGAWRKYSNPRNIKKELQPNPLSEYSAESKSIEDCFSLAISNIEGLLKYANPKSLKIKQPPN